MDGSSLLFLQCFLWVMKKKSHIYAHIYEFHEDMEELMREIKLLLWW